MSNDLSNTTNLDIREIKKNIFSWHLNTYT